MVLAVSRFFSRIFGLGGEQRRIREETIERIIVNLQILEDKVAELRYQMESRSQELFNKVVELLRRNERSKAAIYAGEAVQVRNIVKVIYSVENMIIMTIERLKTMRNLGEVGRALTVFSVALEEIKDYARSVYPNMGMVLDEISRKVKSLIVETSVSGDYAVNIDPTVISREAQRLMEEAQQKAEESVRNSFPVPPIDDVVRLESKQPAQPVTLAASGAGAAAAPAPQPYKPRRPSPEEVEQLVLSYIRSHNGILDIKEFTAMYGVGKNEVLQAIHRLAEKGVISLA